MGEQESLAQVVEKYLNKKANLKVDGITIEVTVMDVRYSYGKIRFGVTPIAGSGIGYFEDVTLT